MSKEEMQRRQLGASQARERRLRDENRRLAERVAEMAEALDGARCRAADLELTLRNMLEEYKGAAAMADSALNGSAYTTEAEEWEGVLHEMGVEV